MHERRATAKETGQQGSSQRAAVDDSREEGWKVVERRKLKGFRHAGQGEGWGRCGWNGYILRRNNRSLDEAVEGLWVFRIKKTLILGGNAVLRNIKSDGEERSCKEDAGRHISRPEDDHHHHFFFLFPPPSPFRREITILVSPPSAESFTQPILPLRDPQMINRLDWLNLHDHPAMAACHP